MPVRKVMLLAAFALAACRGENANQLAATDSIAPSAAQETVTVATARYDAAMFDTVSWVTDSAHLARGHDVFRWACADCHGIEGRGDGGHVLDGDTLHPPSFLNPDWRFANDEEGLRRRIFIGNARGMPHWGLRGMQPRDIVSVEKYIIYDLRKNQ